MVGLELKGVSIMQVRFLTSVSYGGGPSYAPGEIGDIGPEEAKRFIEKGFAEAVKIKQEPKFETARVKRARKKK